MCFNFCELRGNHKSILPYKIAIEKAINDKKFLEIQNEYRKLDDEAFDIANRFGDYKKLTKEESIQMYNEIKPQLDNIRDKRNEYVANIVKNEREKMNASKEINKFKEELINENVENFEEEDEYEENI